MPMTMMDVREMRMGMLQPGMRVQVAVRLARRVVRGVLVLVMLIVHVRVLVHQRLVLVLMLVPLGEMWP
jgi:hypothetical protein